MTLSSPYLKLGAVITPTPTMLAADHFLISCPKDEKVYKKIYNALLVHVGGDKDKVQRTNAVGRTYRKMRVYSAPNPSSEESKAEKMAILGLLQEFNVTEKQIVRPDTGMTKFHRVTNSAATKPLDNSEASAAAIPAIEVVEVKATAEPKMCEHGCLLDVCSWCTNLGH